MSNQSVHSRRGRLLLVAFSCRPGFGSEPGVGWNRAIEAAKRFDTWVLCDEDLNGREIRRYLGAHGPIPGLEFVFVPSGRWERAIRRVPGVCFAAYNWWCRRAYRAARRLHQRVGFDLAHQVNLCTFREPGYLWKLDVPFVWGPFGGTQNYPWRFLGEAGFFGAVSEGMRNLANLVQLRFNGRIRRAARRASALLAATTTNQRDFGRACGLVPVLMSDVGAVPPAPAARSDEDFERPLLLLWSGDLRPCKALSLLIKALAHLPADVPYELRVLGSGPLKGRWQRLARRLGVEPHITWMGFLPYQQAVKQYDWADLFAFTSLRDTTGTVVLEALAAGLPVVCLDHQGAHDIVRADCGIKVPVSNPRRVVQELAEAIAGLARDRTRLATLGGGALKRAAQCSWSTQGVAMAAVYSRVLAEAGIGEKAAESPALPERVTGCSRVGGPARATP